MSTRPILPISRISTIMKSSSDVETVSRESSVLMSKATELFIKNLTQEGYNRTNKGKKLDYKHLAQVVHNDEKYNFLRDILPKKITVLEYKKILASRDAPERAEREAEELSSTEDDEEASTSDTSASSSGEFQSKN
ncbi:chromatin accessibility complex protein 1 [Cylas formicarius]|uniref:chromatin accessibility complex protein 1 n=1 Tax=Cylas formicarius TaxID=197179 RepID=UPI0029585E17|nr:chromatin accessibility complex protein 1 [Cylas formicarius]